MVSTAYLGGRFDAVNLAKSLKAQAPETSLADTKCGSTLPKHSQTGFAPSWCSISNDISNASMPLYHKY
jgi:hypothetical protein